MPTTGCIACQALSEHGGLASRFAVKASREARWFALLHCLLTCISSLTTWSSCARCCAVSCCQGGDWADERGDDPPPLEATPTKPPAAARPGAGLAPTLCGA